MQYNHIVLYFFYRGLDMKYPECEEIDGGNWCRIIPYTDIGGEEVEGIKYQELEGPGLGHFQRCKIKMGKNHYYTKYSMA